MFTVKMSNCMSSSCVPTHPMWCIAVSCYVPPPTSSMGRPSCCCWLLLSLWVRRFLLLIFSLLGSSYDFLLFIYFILFEPFHPASLQKLYLGMPPTLLPLPEPSAWYFQSMRTHTNIRAAHPYMFRRPPTNSTELFRLQLDRLNKGRLDTGKALENGQAIHRQSQGQDRTRSWLHSARSTPVQTKWTKYGKINLTAEDQEHLTGTNWLGSKPM